REHGRDAQRVVDRRADVAVRGREERRCSENPLEPLLLTPAARHVGTVVAEAARDLCSPGMDGLMMGSQLLVPQMLRRARTLVGAKEVVSRRPDRSIDRATYREIAARTRQLAVALRRLGLQLGDRVATLCWNHDVHLEVYFGVPAAGGVVHTLNPPLHPAELASIASHAGDRFIVVDEVLLPVLERFLERAPFEHVIVVPDGFEGLLAAAD